MGYRGGMPAVGDVLAGRYRIDGRLGSGGMATVWRAHDLRLGRDVAVKVLLPNLADDPAMAARFDREARTLAAIADPRVVAVFDVADGDPASGREPFLVMELCADGSLGSLLDARRTLAEGPLLPLLADAAEGLAALHGRGLVHRDVTPRNVLLGGGRAKLGDLGLARPGTPADVTLGLTPPGVTVGTIAYIAPEVRAGGSAGTAADVYGLGAVAYRALTGIPPASGSQIGAGGAPVPAPVALRDLAPGTSEALAVLVTEALATDPATRPAAAALAARLRDLASGAAVPAAAPWVGPVATATTPPSSTAIAPTHVAPPPAPRRSPEPAPQPAPAAEAPRPGAKAGPAAATPPAARAVQRRPAAPTRDAPRTPPPGPNYRGPGLWSGELVLVLLIAAIVIGVALLFFGR